ncbi:hypothetical protein [Streptomyces sp.]|uniref:hypothetical protein n=1 Tax=Streptomyces sp. TaxID=1931 RepID=UPI002F3EF321
MLKPPPGLAMPDAHDLHSPHEWLRIVPAALAVIALAYLPYVVRSGADVLGHLP